MIAALLTLVFSLDTHSRTVPVRAVNRILTACAAVTRADVELALGRKVGRGEEENSGGSSTCDYSGGGGQVTVTMQRLAAAPDSAQEKASLMAEFPNSRVRAANVDGAEAFFLDLGADGTMLHVIRNGRDYVLIAVLGFGEPETVSTAALKLARAALRQ